MGHQRPFGAVPKAFGHPRHGIARSAKLRRLDGVVESYPSTPGDGDTLLFKRSGLPAVPAALAASAGSGQEFRTYALLSGSTRILHSKALTTSSQAGWLYLDPNGVRWLVKITSPATTTDLPAGSGFTLSISFVRYGEFGGTPQTVNRSQSLTTAIFGNDFTTYAGWETGASQLACHNIGNYRLRLEDATRTGGKALVSWVFKDTLLPTYAAPTETAAFQYVPAAMAEISLSLDVGDGLPNFSIAVHTARSGAIPVHSYTGPTDAGSGCPFGAGSKSWSTSGRLIGAMYNDADAVVPVTMDIAWDEQVVIGSSVTLSFNWCPPGSTPPDQPFSVSSSSSSAASLSLNAGAETISINAAATSSLSSSGSLTPAGTTTGESGSATLSWSVAGESLGTFVGSAAASITRTVSDIADCGDGYFRAYEEYEVTAVSQSKAAEPSIRTMCPAGGGCVGEYPMGLLAGPLRVSPGYVGVSAATLYAQRLSNKLWALLWKRDDTGETKLHALLGAAGAVSSFLRVVACTYGAGDPDCLVWGYKFAAASMPINLGAVTLTNLRGSHQPETGETVFATDGTPVCFV